MSKLAILIAAGKPKGKNMNGVEDSSISAPDQGGTMMAPGGSMMEDEDEGSDQDSPGDEQEEGEDMLDIPKGFKPPSAAQDGARFKTTVEACIVDTSDGPKLKVYSIGDMPIHGDEQEETDEMEESAVPSDQQPDQSQQPDTQNIAASYAKRKKDEVAANRAFKS